MGYTRCRDKIQTGRHHEKVSKQATFSVLTLNRRKGQLTIEDWIMCMSKLALDPDIISKLTGLPVPGTLYLAIAEKQETVRNIRRTILIFTRLQRLHYDNFMTLHACHQLKNCFI